MIRGAAVAVLLLLVLPTAVGHGGSFAPLSVTAGATPSSGAFPLNVTLTANATGGWPPYTYDWSFGDGAPNGSGVSVSHVYRWASTFTANVSVTDSVGETTTTSVPVQVHSAALTVMLTAQPASIGLYNQTFLETSVQGGTAPFVYAWSGLPGGCPSLAVENLSCSPTVAGTFDVRVSVTDALGQQANASALLLVTGPTHGGGPSPAAAAADWTPILLGGGALTAVVAIALGVWVARRRRRAG
jgi:hypothetical protein